MKWGNFMGFRLSIFCSLPDLGFGKFIKEKIT